MRTFLTLVWVFLLAVAALAAEPEETWDILYLRGQRVGYRHTLSTTDGGGNRVTETLETMSVQRMGTAMTTETRVRYLESPEGVPLAFRYEANSKGARTLIDGQIANGFITGTASTGEEPTQFAYLWDPRITFPHAAGELLEKMRLEEGATASYVGLIPSSGFNAVTFNYRVLGQGRIPVGGEERELWKVEVTMAGEPELASYEYLDEERRSLRTELPFIDLHSERGTREQATAAIDPLDTPDTMVAWGVRPNLSLYKPRTITEALYRITYRGDDIAELNLEQDYQTVVERRPDSLLLKVAPPARAGEGPPLKNAGDYLGSNLYMHPDDPEVAAVAAAATRGAETAEAKARRLERWVLENIADKNLEVAFASDKETLKNGAGDCTEHGVLLASLCRAAGLPARIAVGFVYSNGLFVGHCWTEAYLGGWVPLDASLGADRVDATHLKLADSSLDNPSFANDLSSLLKGLGTIDIEIVEYVQDGARVVPEPGQAHFRVEGDTYQAPLFGFSFRVPSGWQVVAPERVPYPAMTALQNEEGQRIELVSEEYLNHSFEEIVDLFGESLTEPRLDRTVAGRRAVLSAGGNPGERRLTLVVDRGDTYLVFLGKKLAEDGVRQFLEAVESLEFH